MRTLHIERMSRIKKAVPQLENTMKVTIGVKKTSITIRGDELTEYLAENILKAVDFGFNFNDAILLRQENFSLEFLDIREHTNRHNLADVRSRVIGKQGKTIKTIEKLTGCVIVIRGNIIGILVDSNHLEMVLQGFESLIRGSKHGNIFSYLEKQNKAREQYDEEDLGLKEQKEE